MIINTSITVSVFRWPLLSFGQGIAVCLKIGERLLRCCSTGRNGAKGGKGVASAVIQEHTYNAFLLEETQGTWITQCEEQSLGSCSSFICTAVTNIKTTGNWGENGWLKTCWHYIISGKSRQELKRLYHTHRPVVKQNKHMLPACLLSASFLLHCYDPLEWDAATHNLPGLHTSIKTKTTHVYTSSITEPEQAVLINLKYAGIM